MNSEPSETALVNQDGFVALPENRSARLAVSRIIARIERPPFPLLFLHGPTGIGKSRLIQQMLERTIRSHPSARVQLVAALDLDRWLVSPDEETTLRELRDCELLLIEDAQNLRERSADGLAHLLEERQRRRLPQVVTASRGPAQLSLPQRLTSRLAGGLVVQIDPLSPASRRKLAKHFLSHRQVTVDSEVMNWLIGQGGGGIRPMLGAIQRLEILAKQFPPPLSMSAVELAVQGDPGERTSPIERIGERVAAFYGVTMIALIGPNRHRATLWARQVGMYLARQLTPLSLVQIGQFFGGRDHTTVMHACKKVEESIAQDPSIAREIERFRAEFG